MACQPQTRRERSDERETGGGRQGDGGGEAGGGGRLTDGGRERERNREKAAVRHTTAAVAHTYALVEHSPFAATPTPLPSKTSGGQTGGGEDRHRVQLRHLRHVHDGPGGRQREGVQTGLPGCQGLCHPGEWQRVALWCAESTISGPETISRDYSKTNIWLSSDKQIEKVRIPYLWRTKLSGCEGSMSIPTTLV